MSLFGSSVIYSQREHQLTSVEIERIIRNVQTSGVSQENKRLVKEAIISRRRGDGKISMQQIYEILLHLKNANTISSQDKDVFVRAFANYFDAHFQN